MRTASLELSRSRLHGWGPVVRRENGAICRNPYKNNAGVGIAWTVPFRTCASADAGDNPGVDAPD